MRRAYCLASILYLKDLACIGQYDDIVGDHIDADIDGASHRSVALRTTADLGALARDTGGSKVHDGRDDR
jgi:hypothetical protein